MYRVYCIDGAGRILQADWIEAADDDSAVVAARDSMNCPVIEVWNRERLVARISQS